MLVCTPCCCASRLTVSCMYGHNRHEEVNVNCSYIKPGYTTNPCVCNDIVLIHVCCGSHGQQSVVVVGAYRLKLYWFKSTTCCTTNRNAYNQFTTSSHAKVLWIKREKPVTFATRNAWQSLAYSPLGVVVSPAIEY